MPPAAACEASRSSASQGRAGHHLRHRQRAARLQHRPLPDPRGRHQRQDAFDRPADERWRPLRDRCRRIRPEARPAVRRRKTTCAGTASASSWPWPSRSEHLADHRRSNAKAQASSPTPSTEANGKFLENDKSPPARSAPHRQPRLPLLPRPLLGAGPGCPDRRPRIAAALQARGREAGRLREAIVAELIAVQGKPADIGGYYQPDDAKASAALRPSATLNGILATI